MRIARYKQELQVAVYHVFSRVVDRLFKFDDDTKDSFRELIRKVAFFSGVQVITYAIMSNHFHILVRVQPIWTVVGEEEVRERVGRLYGEAKKTWLKNKVARLREAGDPEAAEALLDSYRARMNDISEFMKTLKLRMTIGFNRGHKRGGTLWEGRFGSVLLEDTPNSELLRLVAAYIDLNPVRANIVRNPSEYGWNGASDAMLNDPMFGKPAKEGIASLYRNSPDRELEEYARLLREHAFKTIQAVRTGDSAHGARSEARAGAGKEASAGKSSGALPLTVLHVKNNTFMRGRAIGRRGFIMKVAGACPVGGVTPCHGGRDGSFLVSGSLARRNANA